MSGLSNIIELIDVRANEKIEQILSEAEEKRERVHKRAQEKAEKLIKKGIKEARMELKTSLAKYGASATLRGKNRVLSKKEELLEDVLKTAIEQIKKKTGTKKYQKILTRLAVEGVITLDEEEVQLVFPEGHEKKVSATSITKQITEEAGKKIKVNISKEHIRASGGVKILAIDGLRWIDNTFEGRLERMERAIRDKIADLLFVGKRW